LRDLMFEYLCLTTPLTLMGDGIGVAIRLAPASKNSIRLLGIAAAADGRAGR